MNAAFRDKAQATAKRFLEYVNEGVSPFHVVAASKRRLVDAGFTELKECESWEGKLAKNGKYFFSRNNTTLFAFRVGGAYDPATTGFKMIGAHTDSPCPRIAPISKLGNRESSLQINTQLYGGGLWYTWLDRDLTLAGRVIVREGDKFDTKLYHSKKPLMRIPSLAIHLQSADERAAVKVKKEEHMRPIFASAVESAFANPDASEEAKKLPLSDRHPYELLKLVSNDLKISAEDIVDFEFCIVDSQPSQLIGIYDEYISSPRLDNLLSSFTALEAIASSQVDTSSDPMVSVISLFDHEEVGSVSAQGAASSVTVNTMKRIYDVLTPGSVDGFDTAMRRSYLISADMAHAIHPNFQEKHQVSHKPHIHDGIVIKVNANQRYTTDTVSEAILVRIAEKSDVPLQHVIVKNDSPCGSTIGPTLSSLTGCKSIDVGAAQLSMHSVREICGYRAPQYYLSLWEGFFNLYHTLDNSVFDF